MRGGTLASGTLGRGTGAGGAGRWRRWRGRPLRPLLPLLLPALPLALAAGLLLAGPPGRRAPVPLRIDTAALSEEAMEALLVDLLLGIAPRPADPDPPAIRR
jgi:hypothetical protein